MGENWSNRRKLSTADLNFFCFLFCQHQHSPRSLAFLQLYQLPENENQVEGLPFLMHWRKSRVHCRWKGKRWPAEMNMTLIKFKSGMILVFLEAKFLNWCPAHPQGRDQNGWTEKEFFMTDKCLFTLFNQVATIRCSFSLAGFALFL